MLIQFLMMKMKILLLKVMQKYFKMNKLILSDLIIYNKKDEKIILPSKFTF